MEDAPVALYDSTPISEGLLVAARAEFARHGLSGARVDRIARAAGINKERIYAYFGNKEGMFEVVVAIALDELVTAIPLNPGDDLAAHTLATLEFHREHPDLLRLLMWEALHYPEEGPPHSEARRRVYRRKVDSLVDGRTGTRDRAALILFMLTGLAAWPQAMRPLGRLITDEQLDNDAATDTIRELVSVMSGALTLEV